ncbi:DUF4382 domain-containing protein [Neptunicella sp. SCSIO 80796]|uniref:DUF4382 domain-containing protein n=1 Tax=Neptunicella plasticusilytica TaxID=3117012 RepID=UPI003A4DD260
MHLTLSKILSPLIILSLVGCGGSDDNDDLTPNPAPDSSTTFSLAVSDAPIDNAISVMVYFDQVELKGEGDPIVVDVRDEDNNPKQIDLLSVQGSDFELIVDDMDIPTGDYTQLRISVTDDSYIEMDQGTFPLQVPSGELKLDGFTALPNVAAAYTLEFDLRKSLVDPVGQQAVFLKPRGVRLVANHEVGVLEGTVSMALITDPSCTALPDINAGNAVYLYNEDISDLAMLGDDADEPADQDEVSPFSTATVSFDESTQEYQFQMGYIPEGDYTLAFTCQAELDLPETDENSEDGFEFLISMPVTVMAEQTTSVMVE